MATICSQHIQTHPFSALAGGRPPQMQLPLVGIQPPAPAAMAAATPAVPPGAGRWLLPNTVEAALSAAVPPA